MEWSNDNVFIRFNKDDKSFSFRDRTDPFNEPAGYSRNVRGAKKAVEYLNQNFNEDYTFSQVINILDDNFNLNIHTYCAMD